MAEILAEILRNAQNFGRNSEEKIGLWSLCSTLKKKKKDTNRGFPRPAESDPYVASFVQDFFLQGKIPPPYLPKLKGDGDTSCFDREFTDEAPNITQIKLKANQVKQCETGFPEFSFTAKSF